MIDPLDYKIGMLIKCILTGIHLKDILSLYACQEATIRTGHGTTDWFQIGKGVHQGFILSPCLFNFYAEYIIQPGILHDILCI